MHGVYLLFYLFVNSNIFMYVVCVCVYACLNVYLSRSDISAKEGIQETTVTLLGLILGMWCTRQLGDSREATWIVFIALTILHVFANYRAMSVLVLNTLNEQRLHLLCEHFIQHHKGGPLTR